ncbi:MAG: SpoIIE family protein phosphatase [Gemmataceae bacterium]
MAILIVTKGPILGRRFPLEHDTIDVGRSTTAGVFLEAQAVSRQHARILREDGSFFVEDLGSSNGTFLNGKRIQGRLPLTEQDTLQIGPYGFVLRHSPTPSPSEEDLIIRAQVSAEFSSSQSLLAGDPAQKLQVILEIAQHLGRTLDLEVLLGKLLDQLMRLFPQTDRAMVLLAEADRLVVRAQRTRDGGEAGSYPYSRTIVQRALGEGVGLLSEDVRADERFQSSSTIASLDLRSLLCVPLIGQDGRRLGVIQLDRFRQGKAFQDEDLQLLTAVGLQTAIVLENAHLHEELLREERLRQELAVARDIQQGFLPAEFPNPAETGYEIYARVLPAREVAGDLYDFFTLEDGRVAFYIGDVSGKGMPAALFMMAVRILGRHLASAGGSPAETLCKLNTALAADNPSAMFVTLLHGVYEPAAGKLVLSSGGHPLPILRKASGKIEMISFKPGRLLGFDTGDLRLTDAPFTLEKGDTLVLYTDGFFEARNMTGSQSFGIERLCDAIKEGTNEPLANTFDRARAAVEKYIGNTEQLDDLSLFLLRRV